MPTTVLPLPTPTPAVNNGPGVIRTYTGKLVDVRALRPEDICIEDIAHALANTCRWGGHTFHFYSVAQHCCEMAEQAKLRGHTASQCLSVLMHDASEAYIGDIPKPIKRLLPEYRTLEEAVVAAIDAHFGLDVSPEACQIAHTLDAQQLQIEWQRLMLSESYCDMHPAAGERDFLRLYHEFSNATQS